MSDSENRCGALVWSPFPDMGSASAAANVLLDEKLVACANMIPQMVSIFGWKGEREQSSETGALFKTNAALLGKAIERIGELHPYEEPAILGWRCDEGAPATLAWLEELKR